MWSNVDNEIRKKIDEKFFTYSHHIILLIPYFKKKERKK